MIRLRRFIRRLRSNEEGSYIIEFAFLIVPFLVIILGGMDLAHQSYVKAMLQGTLSDSARRASVEDPVFSAEGATLEERVKNTLRKQVDPVAPGATYELEVKNFFDFSGVGRAEKLVFDKSKNGRYDASDMDCFEDLNRNGSFDLDTGRSGVGGASDVVLYEATVTMPRLFPTASLIGFSDEIRLSATAAVRNQPYDDQTVPPTLCGA